MKIKNQIYDRLFVIVTALILLLACLSANGQSSTYDINYGDSYYEVLENCRNRADDMGEEWKVTTVVGTEGNPYNHIVEEAPFNLIIVFSFDIQENLRGIYMRTTENMAMKKIISMGYEIKKGWDRSTGSMGNIIWETERIDRQRVDVKFVDWLNLIGSEKNHFINFYNLKSFN